METEDDRYMKRADRIKSELMDMIMVQKRFLPGDKLPNEKELAEELGVSRTTVREAVQYLVTQGMLEVRRGKGTYVMEASQAAEEFGFDSLKVMHVKIRDLYELRMMLEPQMAAMAAVRATDGELEEILRIGKELKESSTVREENSQGNQEFHNAVARASHNEFGIRLMEIINQALVKAFEENRLKQTLYTDMLLDHSMIMEYMKLRDGDGARQAMQLHIRHAIRDYGLDEQETIS